MEMARYRNIKWLSVGHTSTKPVALPAIPGRVGTVGHHLVITQKLIVSCMQLNIASSKSFINVITQINQIYMSRV